jgi:FAD/FMN-containing dehydrogenase
MTDKEPCSGFRQVRDLLRELLGPQGWVEGETEMVQYSTDWLGRRGEKPLGVALPKTTNIVAEVVKICAAHSIAITPLGGNTGLVCGGYCQVVFGLSTG